MTSKSSALPPTGEGHRRFHPVGFVKKDGKQQVKGLVQGVVTHADGSKEKFTALRTLKVKKINGKSLSGVTMRSTPGLAACDVLHLVLGPLDLDLLGLQVHLDKVVLDIVAATGAGKLLGNLLCAITGILEAAPSRACSASSTTCSGRSSTP